MAVNLTIGIDDNDRRLDRVLRRYLGTLPLSAIHKLLRTGKIRLDGRKAQASDRVTEGSVLTLPDLPGAIAGDGTATTRVCAKEANLPSLDIIFEDRNLIVVNKSAGVLVHGKNSLADSVLAHLEGTLPPSLSFTPGPLHRLDQGTTGLVAFSVSLEGARRFSSALQDRLLRKRYLALLMGEMGKPELWEDQLLRDEEDLKSRISGDSEGQRAQTRVMPLVSNRSITLALLEIGTGRTHQIRAQAAHHGHPLAGDKKYGGAATGFPFQLHAYELVIPPEALLSLPARIIAPLPDRFLTLCREAFGASFCRILQSTPPSEVLLGDIL